MDVLVYKIYDYGWGLEWGEALSNGLNAGEFADVNWDKGDMFVYFTLYFKRNRFK